MYAVTVPKENTLYGNEEIFETPSLNCALSFAQTFMENAGVTAQVWDRRRLYAGFFTEDHFERQRPFTWPA